MVLCAGSHNGHINPGNCPIRYLWSSFARPRGGESVAFCEHRGGRSRSADTREKAAVRNDLLEAGSGRSPCIRSCILSLLSRASTACRTSLAPPDTPWTTHTLNEHHFQASTFPNPSTLSLWHSAQMSFPSWTFSLSLAADTVVSGAHSHNDLYSQL